MKTKEELNALKEEIESMNKKLVGLTEEEIAQITGGGQNYWMPNKTSEDGGIIGGGSKWPYSKDAGSVDSGSKWPYSKDAGKPIV